MTIIFPKPNQHCSIANNNEKTTRTGFSDREQRNDERVYSANDIKVSNVEYAYSTFQQQRSDEIEYPRTSLYSQTVLNEQRFFQRLPKTSYRVSKSPKLNLATAKELFPTRQDNPNTQVGSSLYQDSRKNYGVDTGKRSHYPTFYAEDFFQRSSMATASQSSSLLSQQEYTKFVAPRKTVSTSSPQQETSKQPRTTTATQGSISVASSKQEPTSAATFGTRGRQISDEERKRMRLLKNRASAERSRSRQRERLEELIYKVKCLLQENDSLKQDHIALLEYIEQLKACMRQNGISVESIPIPHLHYPTSDSLTEQLGVL